MSQEGYTRWTEDLTDKGKISSLENKTAEQLSVEFNLPSEFFIKEKQRLINRPRQDGKSEITTLNASPRKKVILNKANVCTPFQAFTEIIDNIMDNFNDEEGIDLNIEIEIYLYKGAEEIIIRENSGGIKREKLVPLVRLGEPKQDTGGGIGTWGEGFKIAVAALGRDVKIFTHYSEENPILVQIKKEWWTNEKWDVPVYNAVADTIEEDSTIFIISELNQVVKDLSLNLSDFVEELEEHISYVYGHRLKEYKSKGKNIRIEIKSE